LSDIGFDFVAVGNSGFEDYSAARHGPFVEPRNFDLVDMEQTLNVRSESSFLELDF
jgi:hypothetical protein